MTAHATVHIEAVFPDAPLIVDLERAGRLSIRIGEAPVTVWLSGTADELRSFAVGLAEHVETYEASLEPEPAVTA